MALPLPKVVYDVGPGGPIVTSLQGQNALSNEMLKNAMLALENKYYGPTKQSEIDYRKSETQGKNIENTFSPERMRLANEYQGKINQNYVRNLESEMAQRSATTNHMNTMTPIEAAQGRMLLQNPLLNKSGIAGDIGSMLYLANNPEMANKIQGGMPGQQGPQQMGQPGMQQNPMQQQGMPQGQGMQQQVNPMQGGNMTPGNGNMMDILKQGIGLNLKAKEASTALNQAKAKGYTFNSMPVDFKNYLLALGGGMGINPNEMTKRLANGETVEEIATKEGFDPNNMPEAIYPLTGADRTRLHQRQQANAESKILSKTISEWMAPYSRRFGGYSPKQLGEALKGENPDGQAKYLAALALQPEQAGIRIRSMAGNVGIEAIRELTEKSMGNAKIYQGTISPAVYQKAQDLVEQKITQAMEAANAMAQMPITEQNKKKGQQSTSETPIVKELNGVTYEKRGNDWYPKK